MKLIRFIADDDRMYYGVLEAPEDQEAWLIDGSSLDVITVTENRKVIKNFLPPVMPPNIIGIGLNYAKHAEEQNVSLPERPVMFLKGTNTVIGHENPIVIPAAGPDAVDIEAELAVVIGRMAKNVNREDALNYVLGYCCGNDVSARDWQKKLQKKQWARGKSFDTFCPLGPYLVTRDEIPDPNQLEIKSELNGKVFQSSHTSDMIFDVPAIIEFLSYSMTLLPGTVILTGTPEGVGFARKPPVFIKKGDRVTITIENIGSLSNPVIAETG